LRLSKDPVRLLSAAIAAFLFMAAPQDALAENLHVVAKGQTLGAIAKRYHTTAEALREANNLRRGQQIHPGLALVIPGKGKEAQASKRAEKPRKAEFVAPPRRPGFVRIERGGEKLETQLLTRRGRLTPGALAGLSRILRFYPTGAKIAIDPRLASLIGTVSDHFGGRTIRVVSGFRPYTPAQYTAHSNHNVGKALDFVVEGVPNTVLRDFCRTFRNAGVGYYPNSSFVHLDARSEKAFWIDTSHPGEAPHHDSPGGSAAADEAAKDVEPSDVDSGSNKTQESPSEPVDKKSGNTDTRDQNPARSGLTGQK
jgi:uncharacterized protein YcbK (DUF882 family)